ncbi:MAG: metallophosphoesterase family protein [Tannerella sp.]|nr:metallophosphoesterase family protein [Tannerella sp.]
MNLKSIAITLLTGFALSVPGYAQQRPVLKFHADGTFKILQLTDIHMQHLNEASQKAIKNIHTMLDLEKPDLVIITGDVIFAAPGEPGLQRVLEPLISRKTPFAVTWGNHDNNDCDMSRREMQDYVQKQPFNLGFRVDGLKGESVFNLPVQGSRNSSVAFVIWCMDSGAGSTVEGVKGYGWITPEQIEWYNRESRAFTKANNGVPVPALAFYHIPVPEYDDATCAREPRWIGHKLEYVACPQLNSGFFAATKINGDVMGHFCGHEHNNDFVAMWHGIMLAYGRFSGGNTAYNDLDYNGGRVIILREGVREFETYVRLRNGDIIERAYYPELVRKIED